MGPAFANRSLKFGGLISFYSSMADAKKRCWRIELVEPEVTSSGHGKSLSSYMLANKSSRKVGTALLIPTRLSSA